MEEKHEEKMETRYSTNRYSTIVDHGQQVKNGPVVDSGLFCDSFGEAMYLVPIISGCAFVVLVGFLVWCSFDCFFNSVSMLLAVIRCVVCYVEHYQASCFIFTCFNSPVAFGRLKNHSSRVCWLAQPHPIPCWGSVAAELASSRSK